MIYALFRALARIALRWYYRDVQVVGLERVPRHGPMLLAVNHPNALVDVLLVGWAVPRRVLITAKSTLFTNPIARFWFHQLGVVPLYRTSDAGAPGQRNDPARNRGTFRAVNAVLQRGGAVLIFPEGKSHDEPSLAPLKTGAARMALQARSDGVAGLVILPIGLVFERKEQPRTRVLVQIGEPIAVDEWPAAAARRSVGELTDAIDARLRAVTLNYESPADAERTVRLASLIATVFEQVPSLGDDPRGLAADTEIARRVETLVRRIAACEPALQARADALARRLEDLQVAAESRGLRIQDVGISLDTGLAVRFTAREGWLLLLAGPVALWGRLNHWIPFRAAREIGTRSVESAVDPAMRTLVAGAVLVLATYLVQSVVVGLLWGPLVAFAYAVSLPVAADINFYMSERVRLAAQRARAFLLFKRRPEFRQSLVAELTALRRELLLLERDASSGVLKGC